MKIPNCENAIISSRKINDYLLSRTHLVGKSKAKFFIRVGFDKFSLELALRRHIVEGEIIAETETKFGRKYIIKGNVNAPNGRDYKLLSVWVIESNKRNPYFVTAYPVK